MPEKQDISINRERGQKVIERNLGLRYGSDVQGAAYDLSDIGVVDTDTIAKLNWLKAPTPDWNYRLYNTMAKILSLADQGELLLVTKASGSGERYSTTVGDLGSRWEPYGDGKTFRKCSRLPSNSEIVARRTYKEDINGAELVVWVLNQIDRL